MIRFLQAHEFETIVSFGQDFYREMELPGSLDSVHFTRTWQELLRLGLGNILVDDHEGVIFGGIGGALVPDVYDGRLILQEMFWYVRPEFRHGSTAVRLLKAFETWGRCEGAADIRMVHLYGKSNSTILERLYERNGYKPLEVHYGKSLIGE